MLIIIVPRSDCKKIVLINSVEFKANIVPGSVPRAFALSLLAFQGSFQAMKYQQTLLHGGNGFLVPAGKDIGQKPMPVLVFRRRLALRRGFVASFEPLLDGLDNCRLVAKASTALLFLEAPVQFRGQRNGRFL